MVSRRSWAAAGCLVVVLFVGAWSGPQAGAAPAGVGASTASVGDRALVERSVAFRHKLGLPSGRAHIEQLLDGGAVKEGVERYGVALTASEQRLLAAREALGRAGGQLQKRLAAESADTFAGAYLDQDDGAVVLAFTRDVSANMARARAAFGEPAKLRAASARHSLHALNIAQDTVDRATPQLRAQGVLISGTGISIKDNRLEVKVS